MPTDQPKKPNKTVLAINALSERPAEIPAFLLGVTEEQKARRDAVENRHKAELRLKMALEKIEQCRAAREAVKRASGE